MGYDLNTVERDSNLVCSICLLLLREAMCTPCSHAFCHVCMKKLIAKKDIKDGSFECPECRKVVKLDKISDSPFVDRLVRSSNVYCSQQNEGCEWIGRLTSFFEQHKGACYFQIVSCHHEGCKHSEMKINIEDHESKCKYRIIQCEHCQAAIKVNDIDEHYASCERIPIDCPQDECLTMLPETEMQEHLDQECEFVFVNCSYAKFGCSEKILRKDLTQHNQESTNQHMDFMCDQFLQMQDLTDQLKTANSQIPHLQNEVHNLKTANGKLQTEVRNLKGEVSLLKNKVRKGASGHSARPCIVFPSNERPPSLLDSSLLLNGVEKWIRKNKNIAMGEGYINWYKKILNNMVENKLYQFDDSMFIKVQNENRRVICWSSNSKEEQDHVSVSRGVSYRGDNHYVLLDGGDQLVIETETLDNFKCANSDAFALHTFDSSKLFPFRVKDDSITYNSWCCSRLSYEFYDNDLVVICLLKL